MGPLIPLFWTSGDVFPVIQCQGGSLACILHHICAMDYSDSSDGGLHDRTSGIPGGYRLVSTYDLPDCKTILKFEI